MTSSSAAFIAGGQLGKGGCLASHHDVTVNSGARLWGSTSGGVPAARLRRKCPLSLLCGADAQLAQTLTWRRSSGGAQSLRGGAQPLGGWRADEGQAAQMLRGARRRVQGGRQTKGGASVMHGEYYGGGGVSGVGRVMLGIRLGLGQSISEDSPVPAEAAGGVPQGAGFAWEPNSVAHRS